MADCYVDLLRAARQEIIDHGRRPPPAPDAITSAQEPYLEFEIEPYQFPPGFLERGGPRKLRAVARDYYASGRARLRREGAAGAARHSLVVLRRVPQQAIDRAKLRAARR
jgi:hypothetical protein